jgi:hypothetical protein
MNKKENDIYSYLILIILIIALFANATGLLFGKAAPIKTTQEIVFRIEPSNSTLDNSTIAYANLYYECIKYCYDKNNHQQSCSSSCEQLLKAK